MRVTFRLHAEQSSFGVPAEITVSEETMTLFRLCAMDGSRDSWIVLGRHGAR